MSFADPDPSHDSADDGIARRTVLNAMLTTSVAATGTVLLSAPASAATVSPSPGAVGGPGDVFDVSRPELRAGHNILRLTMDDSLEARQTAVPLTLGTSQETTTELIVTSATGRIAIGTTATSASPSTTATMTVARRSPVTVWVTPVEVGPPLVAADTLTVGTPDGDILIEVWIQPSGGKWTQAGPNESKLDLNISAMHAALMRRPGNSDVVMWSMPRTRDSAGNPKPDPDRPGQWLWWKFKLHDIESRVLDVGAGTTSDLPLPKFVEAPITTPRVDNIFCAGAAHLPNGDLLVVAGHMALKEYRDVDILAENAGVIDNAKHMYIYEANTRRWRKLDHTFTVNRWYPTVTALPDGRMLITSGSAALLEGTHHDEESAGYWGSVANNYLIFDPKGERLHTFTGPLINSDLGFTPTGHRKGLATYPNMFVLPKPSATGVMIAMTETNRGWLYDYEPSDTTKPLVGGDRIYPMNIAGSRSYPTYGAMVLLPLAPHENTVRILAVGGQGGDTPDHHSLDPDQPSTDVVEIFEVDTARPANDSKHHWRYPASKHKLKTPRVLCDATLLADGTVLISGGSQTGWGDLNRTPVMNAELFDPKTEQIRPAADAATDRRYHSTALLQLDGTVLKAGSSGGFGNVSDNPEADAAHKTEIDDSTGKPWMTVHTTAERYWPPYLFAGPRPTILTINGSGDGTVLKYNAPFTINAVGITLNEKVKAALIRLGSVTHGNDMDQRYVWLATTTATRTGAMTWTIPSTVPPNPATAPPGDYQLVILDSHGVPSTGRLVQLQL